MVVTKEAPQAFGPVKPIGSLSDWFAQSPRRNEQLTSLNAIQHGCVWSAVNMISGDIGMIPFPVKRRQDDGGYETADSHPVHRLLTRQPNPWQTPAGFKEWVISTVLIWGNALVYIQRNSSGRIVGLEPLQPDKVDWNIDDNGTPFYELRTMPGVDAQRFDLNQVLHFRGLTNGGFWGWRLVEVVAHDLRFGRSVTQHADAVFQNGAVPGGVLEHPGKLPPEARQQLRDEWHRNHGGPSNGGKIAVLWEGMGYKPLAISNHDAQLLELLQHEPELVARIFNMPPHKLGDFRNNSTRANLEESNRDYFAQTLARRVNMMREELNLKLMGETPYEVQPDPTEILKGDKHTQAQIAQIAVASMVWTRNEARKYMGMNPVEGGDDFVNPNTTGQRNDPPPPEEPQELVNKTRRALQERCVKVAEIERNRLVMAARQRKQFVKWAEEYYTEHLPGVITEAVEATHAIAADLMPTATIPDAVSRYCRHASEEVLRFASLAKQGDLEATIKDEWPTEQMADRLFAELTKGQA